jgi:hypothetical protein
MTITTTTWLTRAEGFVTAAVEDELMMLSVEQGAYYSLDPIAAEIWDLLEQPAQAQNIIATLRERYDVTPEQCETDVLGFLEQLHANGMILLDQNPG